MRLKNSFFNSVHSALGGIVYVFKSERNFRIQLFFAILIICLAIYFPLTHNERLIILVSIFAVLVMEMCNTAVEKFSDLLKPRLNSYVKDIKNIMAGAVLLTSLLSAIIGLYIFIPYLLLLIYK